MTAWEAFWDGVSVLDVVVIVIASGLVVAFFVKGWPWIRGFVRLVDSLSTLPKFMAETTATLEEQNAKIAEIHHEVNYNNGSSVKDAVTRMEVEQSRQAVEQSRQADVQEQQSDMLAAALMSDEQITEAMDSLEQRFTDYEDTFTKE